MSEISDIVKAMCVAPVQIVGTYDTEDGTWLWAWDNPSIVPEIAEHAWCVREYGKQHGIADLTASKFKCDQMQAWEFTALACHLCENQGAYRGPVGTTFVFMTFGKVTLSAV